MKAPSPADLALIDPDGAFRDRLMRDHDSIVALSQQGALRELETVVHRLAGAAATFGYMEIGSIATKLDDAFVSSREKGTEAPDVAPLLRALAAFTKPRR